MSLDISFLLSPYSRLREKFDGKLLVKSKNKSVCYLSDIIEQRHFKI